MRILHVIPTLDRAGAEKQLALLAQGLARGGFDVQVGVLTRMGPLLEPLEAAGIPVFGIEKSWKIDAGAYRRLQREMARRRPDIVQTWIFAANSYGRLAARAARVPHLVASERCVDRWKAWHELAVDRYLARFTDRIVVNSAAVRDFYVERRLPAEKFVVIPNGIPLQTPTVSATPESRAQLLAELRLPADARLIGAVGRLWPQKRYKDLIWAAELLRVARGDTHLLIVGDGPQRERLERFRELIGVRDHVHFLGHREDVPRLLAHLDIFWLGSGYEGQSNALMEAMAAGLPVVVSDIPGNRDLVVPGESGVVFPLGDRAGLARWTHLLLDDPERASRLGAQARQRMVSEFSVETMVARHADLYRQLAGT